MSREPASAQEIVLSVAEQDGGAHVDAELNAKYAALSRANEYGFTQHYVSSTGEAIASIPVRPIELAHVRQVAYEVIVTLTQKAGL